MVTESWEAEEPSVEGTHPGLCHYHAKIGTVHGQHSLLGYIALGTIGSTTRKFSFLA